MGSQYRFGRFEMNAVSGELRKDGQPLKLPPQPSKVLALLVRRAGQVVSQDEIRVEVWGEDTFVDFEAGLHYCLTRIRNVLAEKHGDPRFIETLPRRGYRFIAAVEEVRDPDGIAVLPFANLNHETDVDFLADGVSDAIITELGRLGATRVISRHSTRQFREKPCAVAEIGRALHVDVLVEGSVLRDGDGVRITARLIQVDPERDLWGQAYECDLSEMRATERRVASAIAAQLNHAPSRERAGSGTGKARPAAYEAYLRGRFEQAAWTRDGLTNAVAHFQCAIDADRGFAPPYAGLADSYAALAQGNHLPARDALSKAKAAASKAVALDDGLSDAHAALGRIVLWQDWDFPQSARELVRAIELNPSNEQARMQRALDAATLFHDGDTALSEMREALSVDPLSVVTGVSAAWVAFFVRQYPRAIRQAHATLEIHPLALDAFYVLGLSTCMMGRPDLAIPALERAVQISPAPLSLAYLAHICARAGHTARARAILQDLLSRPPGELLSPKPLVVIYAALGDMDAAFDCLERAFEDRDPLLFSLLSIPVYDALRLDARFEPLAERVRRAARLM